MKAFPNVLPEIQVGTFLIIIINVYILLTTRTEFEGKTFVHFLALAILKVCLFKALPLRYTQYQDMRV